MQNKSIRDHSMATDSWLITGGCGFIGVNLVRALIESRLAKTIRILDNLSCGKQEDLESVLIEFDDFKKTVNCQKITYNLKNNNYSSVELVVEDIRNKEAVEKVTSGIDLVVHLAANTGVAPSVTDPVLDMESNVVGTFNLLEASRKSNVKCFIFASSGAPIGETEPPIHEEKAPRPVSPYGASKLAGEGYCSAYYRTFGLKTVVLRFGNVYGPRSKHKNSVVAKFFRQALSGKPLEIYGDGKQTRDFIYIDDLINAIILAEKSDAGGEVFQIATSRETTINEIADEIKSLIENETGKEITVSYGNLRRGDVRRNYSNISKAKKTLGWEPKFNLGTGLRHSFEYFRNHSFVSKTAEEGM